MAPALDRGLLDTSVFIAQESGRALDVDAIPASVAISAVTLGELHAGVLAASNTTARAQRLRTLDVVSDMYALPIDARVAEAWAELRVRMAEEGRRVNVNDMWIAATASAHGLAVVSQDDDFDALAEVTGLAVVRV
jgi:predicted nucleic acid-binding protein